MKLKPLGLVKEIVEAAGMSISYAYEDLVFIEHNAFLLQFTGNNSELMIHVNREADKSVIQEDIRRLKARASERKMDLKVGSLYTLSQDGDEDIRLEFGQQENHKFLNHN